MKTFNKVYGGFGEKKAREYLENKKYQILATNHRNKIGEIDIIAKDKDTIVFIEVKYKASLLFGHPREMVTYAKQNKIRRVALSYLQQKGLVDKVNIRFDVIDVLGDKITHIENAF